MRTSAFFVTAVAQLASAHYFFDTVAVDGGAFDSSFQHIRAFTRETAYNPIKFSSNPAEDIRDDSTADGDDIICNQGAFANAGNTEVLEVAAGSEVSVKLGVGAAMEHPGPSMVYMSRAPNDDVQSYDGTGEWFKIFEEGVCNEGADFTSDAWCSWGLDTITATIPADTPSGQYLFRAEHIGVHRSHVNQPEHYVSCVQIEVTGGGSGTPGPTVEFPGAYSDSDEYANFSIYNGYKDFPMPGPAVWSSGGSGGSTTTPDDSAAAPEESSPATPPAQGENDSPAEDDTPAEDETPEFETPGQGDAPGQIETPDNQNQDDNNNQNENEGPATLPAPVFGQEDEFGNDDCLTRRRSRRSRASYFRH